MPDGGGGERETRLQSSDVVETLFEERDLRGQRGEVRAGAPAVPALGGGGGG